MTRGKKGFCIDCEDDKPKLLTAKRCAKHYKAHRVEVAKFKAEKREEMNNFLKQSKPIKKISDKQLKKLSEYRKLRDEFTKDKNCEAKLSGCTITATDLHHARGRVGNLLIDVSNFVALCRNCHTFIELNPDFAKKNGFSKKRL